MNGDDGKAMAADDPAARLLAIVEGVVRQLKPGHNGPPVSLTSSLDCDLGLDSLARVELASRLEAAFGRTLGDEAATGAERVHDLLLALTAVEAASPGTATATGGRSGATGEVLGGVITPPPEVATLDRVLAWHAARHPERLHLRLYADDDDGEVLTFGALLADAQAVASGLQAAGIVPGDAVALMLPPGRAYFAAFCGTLLAGAICVPIYPPSRIGRIEEHVQRHLGILGNATARALIVPEEAKPLARVLQAQLADVRIVATVEELSLRGDRPQPVVVAADDPALLQYTSGSTGAPKGVTLSHANLLANIRAMAEALHVRWRRCVRQLAAALP